MTGQYSAPKKSDDICGGDPNMLEDHDYMDENTCKLVAEFFSVYSSQIRMNILCALRSGPKTVSEMAEYTHSSMQNMSQHLRIMRDKGALRSEKRGQHVYYSVINMKFLYGISMIKNALLEELQNRANEISPS
ncbi:MAG: winged helix-turn-helix transcriptional regulator [Candidatus Hydrogenedentes bacterium]|nr:winged helix-turn-helix transcriptional regulator [Candidatus Hydrogenedentota bacterium]